MATNGANINNPSLQGYVAPKQLEQPVAERPRVKQHSTAHTERSHSKQRGLEKDTFQKAEVKQEVLRHSQETTVKKHSPEQAQQLAQKIANNSIATGNAALIAQPNTQKPEDKKDSKNIERKIARLVREGKTGEASELATTEIKNAFAKRDIESANKWMQKQQKIRSGKLSLPTPDLVADGQMSTIYARGLSNAAETTDLLNNIAATPGAGSVADAKLASYLRNKSGTERMAAPAPNYTPKAASITERATTIASLIAITGNAPWDSKNMTKVMLLRS